MTRPRQPSPQYKLALFTLAIFFTASALLPAPALAAPAAAPPVPVAPSGSTTDTTPTFQWTRVAGATAYQLEVIKNGVTVYVVGVPSSACTATLCSKTPATVLDFIPHVFRVRAKVAGVWGAWSALRVFVVQAPGFSNNFNGSEGFWIDINGPWLAGPNTLYSEGAAGEYSSIAYPALYSTFTVQAKMRRNSCPDCALLNGLFFRGNPGSTDPAQFYWNNTFMFGYTNEGKFIIGWVRDGAQFTPTGFVDSPAIVPGGFNILKVTANGAYMQFFINGQLVADGQFTVFNDGYVGLFLQGDTGRLDVDYATLTLTAPAAPDAAADAAGVLHLDDSMAVPFDLFGSP